MQKLGIALANVGPSHLSYRVIRGVNEIMRTSHDTDIILFYEQLAQPCVPPLCSLMHINEVWGFDGQVIATNINTASKLVRSPGPSKKIFYCWDLDWLRIQQKQYEQLHSIYSNPQLQLVARSVDHQKLLVDLWGAKNVPVIEDFELPRLIEMIYGGSTN
jgi:hypothetical protein